MGVLDGMLSVRGLSRTYLSPDFQVNALRNVDLDIKQGQFTAVLGPSGSGKTTLLNILGLIDRPTAGRYQFDGVEIGRFPERKLAELRRNRVGFIFQTTTLVHHFTVHENIGLALTYSSVSNRERARRAEDAMDRVGISHRAECRVSEISATEQRRVEFARAIVRRPKILFADEPAAAQSAAEGEHLMRILCALNGSGTTVVMATHSLRFAGYSNEIVYLDDGERTDHAGFGDMWTSARAGAVRAAG
jgi:putative ABC transport system ATP-binding protein